MMRCIIPVHFHLTCPLGDLFRDDFVPVLISPEDKFLKYWPAAVQEARKNYPDVTIEATFYASQSIVVGPKIFREPVVVVLGTWQSADGPPLRWGECVTEAAKLFALKLQRKETNEGPLHVKGSGQHKLVFFTSRKSAPEAFNRNTP